MRDPNRVPDITLGQHWLPAKNMTPLQREYLITLALMHNPRASANTIKIDDSSHRPIVIVYAADCDTFELVRYRGDKYGVLRKWDPIWKNVTKCGQWITGSPGGCKLPIGHAGDHDPNNPNTEESE